MEHFKHIKVTTTSSLQNIEILEYIEPITVSIVIGMNFFKDFLSGFRDVFGGKSNTYTKSLEKINQQAINELKKRAHYLKANYVIGLTIENDEIASQGKSMIMVTAMGTAIKVASGSKPSTDNSTSIDLESFQNLELKYRFISDAEKDKLELNDKKWELIINNRISELCPYLLKEFMKNTYSEEVRNKLFRFFEEIDEETAIKEIFEFIRSNPQEHLTPILDLIKELHLVDLNEILKLISSEEEEFTKAGAIIAGIHKKIYFKSDIELIKEIIRLLDEKYPVVSDYYEAFDNLMNREILIWKCECGKENDAKKSNCRKCGKDIHGMKNSRFNLKEIKDSLKHRLKVLESNFE